MNVIDDAALAAAIKSVTDPLMSRIEAMEDKIAQQTTALEAQAAKDAADMENRLLVRIDNAQKTADALVLLVKSGFDISITPKQAV